MQDALDKYGLDRKTLPRHIAIVMDGNGRWARRRGLSRIEGHRHAEDAVRDTVEACAELGIGTLTLYAFSIENWSRPKREVNALMRLLRRFIRKETPNLMKNRIRFRAIGRDEPLPAEVLADLRELEQKTVANEGLTVVLAVNYGGRTEIADAAKRLAARVKSGDLALRDVDEQAFADCLYTRGIPDVDLLIRTSGESRVSNFLLWQAWYAELWITPVLWPDFRRAHLIEAIKEYARRDRRFGGVGES
ncbi:MAG: isoprenyl transferase [Verrucomicrobia bacterium]|nr:isoprenyl transferase [Verrucomicrobiota bacterium]